MADHARVEVAVVGVERLDPLEVEVEGRLVEPLLGGERPPARLLRRELVLDVPRRERVRVPLMVRLWTQTPVESSSCAQDEESVNISNNDFHGLRWLKVFPEPT